MLSPAVVYSLLILVFQLCFSVRFTIDKTLGSPYNIEENVSKLKGSSSQKILRRTRTTNNRKKYIKTAEQLDNSVSADGIAHYEIKNNGTDWKEVNEIEDDFKNMLAMKGLTFIYKRDTFWRTWRDVRFSNTSQTTIFYKCTNIITTTCDGCYGGGFWTIDEDRISCPYEIFSMLNKNQICVVNYAQIDKINESCPSVTSLNDLMLSCNNPIITMYRVTKVFNSLTSERKQTDICRGREYCDISTFYRIYDDYILFRLLNSSNDVIYSKIMKHNKKNYVCVTNCGRLNILTKIVKKTGENGKNQHVTENGKNHENSKNLHANKTGKNQHVSKYTELKATNSKSSDHQNKIPASSKSSQTQSAGCEQNNFSSFKELLQKLKQAIVNNRSRTRTGKSNSKGNKRNKTPMSPCQKLRTTTEDYEEENCDYSS